MRYRSIHTLALPVNYSHDDLRAAFTLVTPPDTEVKVTRHGKYALGITVVFRADSDAMAKEVAASVRREATIIGSTDHLAIQVSTRNGWQTLS